MYNCIVLAGPTAVGKTELSIKLAKKIQAEIISADSSQVYKEMNIGTAKIQENEKEGIRHHLIDVVYPNEEYNMGIYYKQVNDLLNKDDRTYIITGGTGLYIQAITDGITQMPEVDRTKRQYLESLELKDLLSLLDNTENLDINNKQRVIRKIETKGIEHSNIKGNNRKILKIFLTRDRENLYDRINKRVDIMFNQGLLDEARYIYRKYQDKISSIGYKELFEYFKGNISLDEAKEDIKKASRRYAKRQITWFKNKGYIVYNLDEISVDEVLNKIIGEMKYE